MYSYQRDADIDNESEICVLHKVLSPFPVGSVIRGRYTVVSLLGQTTTGATYLVRDKRNQLDRFVLKEVMHTARKEGYGFPFNAASLKKLKHSALPQIYQVFFSDKHERAYILMDYIEGRNLEEVQQQRPEGRASLPQAITLISPIIDAVSYLHQQQPPLIHGNINPSNVIMPKTGSTPVLINFLDVKEYSPITTDITPHQNTLNYRAPEQYGSKVGVRADIYALSALLNTLLTGTTPASATERLEALELKEPDPLLPVNQIVPSVPAQVALAIYRALSLDSHDRFSTVEQFWEALWQVIPVNTMDMQVPRRAVTFPVEEQSQGDVNPTEHQIVGQVSSAPVEEPSELEFHEVVPQITESVVPTQEVDTSMLDTNSNLQASVPPVFASFEAPIIPAFPEEWKPPARTSLQKQSPLHRLKKPRPLTLLFLGLALLVSISLVSGIWFYSAGLLHLPIAHPTPPGQFKSTPQATASTVSKGTVTPGPISIPYPKLVGQYTGYLYNIPDSISSKMSLTGVQQQQGTITGYYSGLLRNGRFQGTINTARHISFVTTGDGGQVPISFEGAIQSDGVVSGSYCIQNQAKQCSSYGLWSVSPTPSK